MAPLRVVVGREFRIIVWCRLRPTERRGRVPICPSAYRIDFIRVSRKERLDLGVEIYVSYTDSSAINFSGGGK